MLRIVRFMYLFLNENAVKHNNKMSLYQAAKSLTRFASKVPDITASTTIPERICICI
jgi:hypothetical protein